MKKILKMLSMVVLALVASAVVVPASTARADDAAKTAFFGKLKKGTKWTVKSTMIIQGMDPMITYTKTEISDFKEGEYYETTTWMLDKDKNVMAGMPAEGTKYKMEYKEPAKADGEAKKVDPPKEETIEAAGKKFVCYVFDNAGTKSWSAKEYPGLTVKMESATMNMALEEFTE